MRTWTALTLTGLWIGTAVAATPSYETPQWRSALVLPPAEQSGTTFTVLDPVTTDGLMPRYRLQTPYGPLTAYGHAQLQARLREITALEIATSTSDLDVVADTTKRRVEGTLKTVVGAARDPIGLVQGLPRGIVNLFRGTAAQAREWGRDANKATQRAPATQTDRDSTQLKAKSTRYAERYLGITAGERSWFERLGVDPYTDNEALRRVVRHLAKVEAATSLGLRLASLPSIPYSGDLQRVMEAVYHEDPAILRERRRDTLLGYGLSAEEIDRFENTPALSPTRQLRLATAASHLAGVKGLDAFFRQASQLQSADEAEIYVASVEGLSRVHTRRPLAQILTASRLPGAVYADERGCVVVAAVESVYWTSLTDEGERSLHAGLPPDLTPTELWITGYVSDEALRQLTARHWMVQPYAFDDAATP